MISEVAEVVVSGGILAYELVLSAPKSVSVAALAGSQVEGRILEAHLSAVDDVLSLIAPNLFERRMEEKRAFVNPSDATFLAFTHPWNRVIEPQLHTHVTISRPRGGNALWGYPLFLLQRTLRAIYHYSLVSRLRGQGFRIRVGEPWSLAWELGGIADAVIWKFTERTKAIREQVASAVDLIVQQSRLKDGTRKIVNITEVQGMEGDVIIMQDVFVFEQTGVVEGKIVGRLKPTGIRPRFVEKFEVMGIRLPPGLFGFTF